MIRGLFKMLNMTTVYCLLATGRVLIGGDYVGSIADGSQTSGNLLILLHQVKHDHQSNKSVIRNMSVKLPSR
mgnify:CR=1 FL=1